MSSIVFRISRKRAAAPLEAWRRKYNILQVFTKRNAVPGFQYNTLTSVVLSALMGRNLTSAETIPGRPW